MNMIYTDGIDIPGNFYKNNQNMDEIQIFSCLNFSLLIR